jgi:hypothetical protein
MYVLLVFCLVTLLTAADVEYVVGEVNANSSECREGRNFA